MVLFQKYLMVIRIIIQEGAWPRAWGVAEILRVIKDYPLYPGDSNKVINKVSEVTGN